VFVNNNNNYFVYFDVLLLICGMSALLKLLCEYLTLRDVLFYGALLFATWLFYKVGIEPFLSPIRKVGNMVREKMPPQHANSLCLLCLHPLWAKFDTV